jgi:hypothetical protein
MATTTYGTPYVSGTDLVANWPAASLTVANSIDAAGYYVGRGINAQTASYTGVLTDAGKTVTMTNAGATTFTVPANASVAYPTGTRINILNLGAGACTPTAGAGVTISGTITALATNGFASLVKTATNTWSYMPPGGFPASATATVATYEQTSSTSFTDLTTAGPAVTLTTGTKALLIITSRIYAQDSGGYAYVGVAVSGATTIAAAQTYCIEARQAQVNDILQISAVYFLTGLTAGTNTFTLKYKQVSATNGYFSNRSVAVIDMGS